MAASKVVVIGFWMIYPNRTLDGSGALIVADREYTLVDEDWTLIVGFG